MAETDIKMLGYRFYEALPVSLDCPESLRTGADRTLFMGWAITISHI